MTRNEIDPHFGLLLGTALLLSLLAGPARAGAAAEPVLSVGDRAPGFFLKTINAKAVGMPRLVLANVLEDEATKGVVISFFATWCAPCKKELPVLQQLWEAYEKDGLRIVVVSIDKEKEALDSLSAFIAELGLTYPVVSDRFNLLARRYLGTTTSLPSLFITDGDGVIKSIHQSYDDDAGVLLEKELAGILGITIENSVVTVPEEDPAAAPEGETKEAAATEKSAAASKKVVKKGKKKAPGKKATKGKKQPAKPATGS